MMPETDPFLLLAMDDSVWPAGADPFWAALRRFDENNPGPLISLLEARDPIVRQRGLSLFGWLGKKAFPVLDHALRSLRSLDDPSVYARSNLMDGVISYTRTLRPDQVAKVLQLATDDEDVVRGKVIAFIGAVRLEVLEAAILLLDESEREKHAKGYKRLLERPDDIDAFFDQAISKPGVQSTYELASIERMAREGAIAEAPRYYGNSYIARDVLENTKRLIANRARRNAKPATG
jgi:hypothetical protein